MQSCHLNPPVVHRSPFPPIIVARVVFIGKEIERRALKAKVITYKPIDLASANGSHCAHAKAHVHAPKTRRARTSAVHCGPRKTRPSRFKHSRSPHSRPVPNPLAQRNQLKTVYYVVIGALSKRRTSYPLPDLTVATLWGYCMANT